MAAVRIFCRNASLYTFAGVHWRHKEGGGSTEDSVTLYLPAAVTSGTISRLEGIDDEKSRGASCAAIAVAAAAFVAAFAAASTSVASDSAVDPAEASLGAGPRFSSASGLAPPMAISRLVSSPTCRRCSFACATFWRSSSRLEVSVARRASTMRAVSAATRCAAARAASRKRPDATDAKPP